MAAINTIILARRLGNGTVQIRPADSPAVRKAAYRAGLGQAYRRVPLREDPSLDRLRKHGVLAPDVDFGEPSDWQGVPEYVTVDVGRTIWDGRVVVRVRHQDVAGEASR